MGTSVIVDKSRNFKQWNVALGDVDGDNDLDAFVVNDRQANKIWLNNGTGIFSDSGQSLDVSVNSKISRDVALKDLDGDGDYDAFVVNDGEDKVWLNNGTGVFSDTLILHITLELQI